jgi:hypothetical protein
MRVLDVLFRRFSIYGDFQNSGPSASWQNDIDPLAVFAQSTARRSYVDTS